MMYIPLIPLCNVYKTTPVVCCKKFGTKPVLSLDINLFFEGDTTNNVSFHEGLENSVIVIHFLSRYPNKLQAYTSPVDVFYD